MYLNFIVESDRPHVTHTRASVVPPSRYSEYPMFWVDLTVGTDSLNLGTRNPEHLVAMLREAADKLDAKVAEHAEQTATEVAA